VVVRSVLQLLVTLNFYPNSLILSTLMMEAIRPSVTSVLRSVLQLLVNLNFFPNSLILSTLMMEAIRPSEMSVLTSTTLRHIPEDDIIHSHRRENHKYYIALTGWAL
jgi:hypothetical protein